MSKEETSDDELSNEDNILLHWTKEEKFDLLQALKVCSSHSTDKIKLAFPSKTEQDIKDAIKYYMQKVVRHPIITERRKKVSKVVKCINRVPLSMWIDLLHTSFNNMELRTETAAALRIIADCENMPSPVCTSGHDFKLIYHVIANAIEGKAIPNDRVVNSLLEKCIIETAYTSKAFIRNSTLRAVIESINVMEKHLGSFPRPTDNNELAALRHLYAQKSYNPLKIPEEVLKGSMYKS